MVTKVFHFGTLSFTHEEVKEATKFAVKCAKEAGIHISFDPNLREPLWKNLEDAKKAMAYGFQNCDILKIADNELQFFTGEEDFDQAVSILQENYKIPLICVTLGKDGSRAYYKGKRVFAKPFLQDATIETTGAGDTFTGCMLNFVLEKGLDDLTESDLAEMLIFANVGASLITTRRGALKVMPEKEEIEKIIQGCCGS